MNNKIQNLNKAGIIASLSLLSVSTVFASQFSFLGGVVSDFTGSVVTALGYLLMSLAVVVFFWGIVKYINGKRQGSEEKTTVGKNFMSWGLLALFVMFSVWGIINFAGKSTGIFQGGQIAKPCIDFVTGNCPTSSAGSNGYTYDPGTGPINSNVNGGQSSVGSSGGTGCSNPASSFVCPSSTICDYATDTCVSSGSGNGSSVTGGTGSSGTNGPLCVDHYCAVEETCTINNGVGICHSPTTTNGTSADQILQDKILACIGPGGTWSGSSCSCSSTPTPSYHAVDSNGYETCIAQSQTDCSGNATQGQRCTGDGVTNGYCRADFVSGDLKCMP